MSIILLNVKKIFIRTISLITATLVALVFFVLVKLSLGPINISFLAPYLENIIHLKEKDINFEYSGAHIELQKLGTGVNVVMDSIELSNKYNYVDNFSAKKLEFSININDLLSGHFKPKDIILNEANISIFMILNNILGVFRKMESSDSTQLDFAYLNSIRLVNSDIKFIEKPGIKEIKVNKLNGKITFLSNKGLQFSSIASSINYIKDNESGNLLLPEISGVLSKNIKKITVGATNSSVNSSLMDNYLEKDNYIQNYQLSNINMNIDIGEKVKNIKIKSNYKSTYSDSIINAELNYTDRKNINGLISVQLYNFNPSQIKMKFKNNNFNKIKNINSRINGLAVIRIKNSSLLEVDINASSSKGEVYIPLKKKSILKKYNISSMKLNLKYSEDLINIIALDVKTKTSNILVYGNIIPKGSTPAFNLMMVYENGTYKEFSELSKNLFSSNKFRVVDGFLKQASIPRLVVEFSRDNSVSSAVKLMSLQSNLKNIQVTLGDGKPNISSRSGTISYTYDSMEIKLSESVMFLNNTKVSLNNTDLIMKGIFNNKEEVVNVNIKSNLDGSFLDSVLLAEKFFIKKINLTHLKKIDGKATYNANINYQFYKKTPKKIINYNQKIAGELKDINSKEDLLNFEKINLELSGFNGKFNIIDKEIDLIGTGIVNNEVYKINLLRKKNGSVSGKFATMISSSIIKQKSTNYNLEGEKIPLTINFTNSKNNILKLDCELNIENAILNIDFLDYYKKGKDAGFVSGTFIFKDGLISSIKNLSIDAPKLVSVLDIDFDKHSKIKEIQFKKFLDKNFNFNGTVSFKKKGLIEVNLDAEEIDITDLIASEKENQFQDLNININVNNLKYKEINLGSSNISALIRSNIIQELNSFLKLDGNDYFKALVSKVPNKNTSKFNVSSGNAGLLAKNLGLSESIINGKLLINGEYSLDPEESGVEGNFDVHNFSVINASVLTRLLQVASFTGLMEILVSEGIPFNNFTGTYSKKNNKLFFYDSRAEGNSIGITVDGFLDFEGDDTNLEGVLMPAYTINSLLNKIPIVGKIITGIEGEGFIGVNYAIRGSLDNPSLSINPLSIFTPGIIRNIVDSFKIKKNDNIEKNNAY